MAKLISRRDFLKGTAAGAFSLAAAGVLGTGTMLTAAAEDEESVPQRAVSGLEGWVECFERAKLAGSVFMGGVTAAGENPGHPALDQAYRMGTGI